MVVIVDPHCSQKNNDDTDKMNGHINNIQNQPFASSSIASAFQAASDQDVHLALKALSFPNNNELTYYAIPCLWMTECLPYLKGETDDKPMVGICNEYLLESEHAISDDDNDDNDSQDSQDKKRKWHQQHAYLPKLKNKPLKSDLEYGRDYFLVGKTVWGILSEKFDVDVELERTCTTTTHESRLAVQMGKNNHVTVPSSGRFSLEQVVVDNQMDETDVVSDDEPNDDLFPGLEKEPEPETPTRNDSPLLLLPASTTTTATTSYDQNGRFKSIYPSNNDMDLEEKEERLYPAGLGNLGNTCFMNSTIQCLAHTAPLRKYFLSGEYESDLNRDNPLGTGGELATEFAELLKEMWGHKRSPGSYYSTSYYSSPAVYPRKFKTTLGKHAAQFLGYDQHDSHELATYLLDALLEDTNRITKKPYVEKPEQGENEPDHVAAAKAWSAHLQREDSRVLENFMGQVKSRVQCPVEGCGRVSTTFDPTMYLSVPIPGATDRTLAITYIPLEGRRKELKVTLKKTSNMAELKKKVIEVLQNEHLEPQDLCLADVWVNEVYSFYHNPNDEIEKIRDMDTTHAFELKSLSNFDALLPEPEVDRSWDTGTHYSCHALDRENEQDWVKIMDRYIKYGTLLYNHVNKNRGSFEEKVAFLHKLETFVERLHTCSDAPAASKEEDPAMDNDDALMSVFNEPTKPTLSEKSEMSSAFRNINTPEDLALFEGCVEKFREFLYEYQSEEKSKYKDGITVQVAFQRKQTPLTRHATTTYHTWSADKTFTLPLAMRVPPTMTVYELRQEIATRLSRCLKTGRPEEASFVPAPEAVPEPISPTSVVPIDSEPEPETESMEVVAPLLNDDLDVGSPEMLILRQVPLTASKKSEYGYSSRSYSAGVRLGMLETGGHDEPHDGRPIHLASPSHDDEKELVCETVGEGGTVHLHWPAELSEQCFDKEEYELCEPWKDPDEMVPTASKKTTTVLDCIERYCQMEQLEETEKWYCNRCKEHVRAWKQFHLYRTPPILVVHLKRFHYSATTHRRDKIDSYIDFPLTGLDLTEHVMEYTEEEKPLYDLYAVSNHFGGLGGGHYTAYALSDDGKWCNFDDSRVTADVDPKEVKSNAAYVLYYRRRDVSLDGLHNLPRPAIVQDNDMATTTSDYASLEANTTPLRESDLDSNRSLDLSMGSVDNQVDNHYDNYGHGGPIAPNDYPLQ